MNINTLVKSYYESIYFISTHKYLLQKQSILTKVENAKYALDELIPQMDSKSLSKYISANKLLAKIK